MIREHERTCEGMGAHMSTCSMIPQSAPTKRAQPPQIGDGGPRTEKRSFHGTCNVKYVVAL